MSRDVEGFTAAALTGLCSHGSAHRNEAPEDIASRALAIGMATAKAMEHVRAMDRAMHPEPPEAPAPPPQPPPAPKARR